MIHSTTSPDLPALQRVSRVLRSSGIDHALGGSGLLLALGLTDAARDWDLTTDADPETVAAALAPFNPTRIEPNGPYATAAMFRFTLDGRGGAPFDVMCRFAIRHEGGLWRFPTIVAGAWNGVPLSRVEPWLVAYAIMNRHERVSALLVHLRRTGADLSGLCAPGSDPVPDHIERVLGGLPHRA